MIACPYCGCDLQVMPSRKKKCPSCEKPIYIKYTPENRTKRLMTETEAAAAEESWKKHNERNETLSLLYPFDLNASDLDAERSRGLKSDRESAFSLLSKFWVTTKDLHKRALALGMLARLAAEAGRPFENYLKGCATSELERLRANGIKKVEILISEGTACSECASHKGEIFDIEACLRNMPLPRKNCHNLIPASGFCRCSFVAHF